MITFQSAATFSTAQIAYIVTIVRIRTDECGIVSLTLS